MRAFLTFAVISSACTLCNAVVIGFEEQPVGADITNQYQALGIVFDSVPNSGSSNTATVTSSAIFGNRAVGPGGPAPNFGGTLIMLFATPATTVGSWVFDEQSPTTVTAYDINNIPVGSHVLDGQSSPPEFWSLSHAAGIARVEIVPTNTVDGWVVDDVTFTLVPSLGTLPLLAFSAAFRRRR